MMLEGLEYEMTTKPDAADLMAFYRRQGHATTTEPSKLQRMIDNTACFVVARLHGELIGIARGVADGVWGRLVECKLDPAYQGPACVTRREGRVEHDASGIARRMAMGVVDFLVDYGCERIDALAYGTEVDFCEELGFKRMKGVVPLELVVADRPGAAAAATMASSGVGR